MAAPTDIAEVRRNTDERDANGEYSDVLIGGMIDALDVVGATAKIWEEKAAAYSGLVDTTEAGASHKFSDLSKAAKAQADYWRAREADIDESARSADHPKIKAITRT